MFNYKYLTQKIATHVLIVNNNNNSFLILKRSSTDKQDPNTWDLAGGGIESTETLEEGAKREVLEETGLKISKVYIIGACTIDGKDIQILTKADVKVGKQKVHISREHSDYKWIDFDYLLKLKDSSFHLLAAQKILKSKAKINLKQRFNKFKYKSQYYYYLF